MPAPQLRLTDATERLTPAAARTEEFSGQILFGDYEVAEIIGEGGMGAVFRARQISTKREVAVKVLHRHLAADEQSVRRFENEAKVIGRLRHPNTIRLIDCKRTDGGDLCLVTELLHGAPLSGLLEGRGKVPLDRALSIVCEICRSLAEAHGLGIIHRDLKPENVFVEEIGDDDVVRVVDFGIALSSGAGPRVTRPGLVLGTPLYMAPEQFLGEHDTRSDIYALGVMLFEMLTGKPPFECETISELAKAHCSAPRPSIALTCPDLRLVEDVDCLVQYMLRRNGDERIATVQEVRARAQGLLARLRGVADAPAAPHPPGWWASARVGAVGFAMSLSFAIGAWVMQPEPALPTLDVATPRVAVAPPVPASPRFAPSAAAAAAELRTIPARPEAKTSKATPQVQPPAAARTRKPPAKPLGYDLVDVGL